MSAIWMARYRDAFYEIMLTARSTKTSYPLNSIIIYET